MKNATSPLKTSQDLKSRLTQLENYTKSKQKPFYDISFPSYESITELSFNLLQLLNPLKPGFKVDSKSDTDKMSSDLTLADSNPLFALFILGTSEKGFHNSFEKFYQRFDRHNKLHLEEEEFISMVSTLLKESDHGKAKISKCFEKIMPQNSKKANQNSTNTFDAISNRELIRVLQHKSNGRNLNKIFIDYLKLFPFLLAFFSDHIDQEIKNRKEILEKVQGFTVEGAKKPLVTTNILQKFEAHGFSTDGKKPQSLGYREIEKILMLFHGSDIEGFEREQLCIVLEEMQKKYNFNSEIGDFVKKKYATKKFFSYLSYRICMHSSCNKITKQVNDDPQTIVEEFVLWNTTYNEKRLDEKFIENNFLKYAGKRMNINNYISPTKLYEMFSGYIKKIVPTIPKKLVKNITENFISIISDDRQCTPKSFSTILYELIIHEAEVKLKSYIHQVFEKLAPDSNKDEQESPIRLNPDSKKGGQGPLVRLNTIYPVAKQHSPRPQDANLQNIQTDTSRLLTERQPQLTSRSNPLRRPDDSSKVYKSKNEVDLEPETTKYEEEMSKQSISQTILSDANLRSVQESINQDLERRSQRLNSLTSKLQQSLSMSKNEINVSLLVKNPSKILEHESKAENLGYSSSVSQKYEEQKDRSMRLKSLKSKLESSESQLSSKASSKTFSLEEEFPTRVNSRIAINESYRQKDEKVEPTKLKTPQNQSRNRMPSELAVISEDCKESNKKIDSIPQLVEEFKIFVESNPDLNEFKKKQKSNEEKERSCKNRICC